MGEPDAIVAVLAGGRGERLGGAKPSARLCGKPLIAYPLAAAHAAGLETIVVAKRTTALPALAVHTHYEPELPHHPLCGVLAALSFARTRPLHNAVVLVACDMPFLTGALLRWLAALRAPVVAKVQGRTQPLLSRCEQAHTGTLEAALQAGASLRAAFAALDPLIVDERDLSRFGDPARLCANVNDASELARAQAQLC